MSYKINLNNELKVQNVKKKKKIKVSSCRIILINIRTLLYLKVMNSSGVSDGECVGIVFNISNLKAFVNNIVLEKRL